MPAAGVANPASATLQERHAAYTTRAHPIGMRPQVTARPSAGRLRSQAQIAQIAQVDVGEVGAAEVLLAALIVQEIVRVEVVAELQVAEVKSVASSPPRPKFG